MLELTGKLTLLGDTVPGECSTNQGLIYIVEVESDPVGFVLREKKDYISKLKLQKGDRAIFVFRKDVSPKFGDVFLLESYAKEGQGKTYFEEGRRILIHRGNKASHSAGCWLCGEKTETFSCRDGLLETKVTASVKTLQRLLAEWPEKVRFRLIYE